VEDDENFFARLKQRRGSNSPTNRDQLGLGNFNSAPRLSPKSSKLIEFELKSDERMSPQPKEHTLLLDEGAFEMKSQLVNGVEVRLDDHTILSKRKRSS